MVIFSNCTILWVPGIQTYIALSTLTSGSVVFYYFNIDSFTLKNIIKGVIEKLVMISKNMKFVSSSTV